VCPRKTPSQRSPPQNSRPRWATYWFWFWQPTAQPDATCKSYIALTLTHNALHTQAWSPSPCSHTIPRDRASEFILLRRGFKMGPVCSGGTAAPCQRAVCVKWKPTLKGTSPVMARQSAGLHQITSSEDLSCLTAQSTDLLLGEQQQ